MAGHYQHQWRRQDLREGGGGLKLFEGATFLDTPINYCTLVRCVRAQILVAFLAMMAVKNLDIKRIISGHIGRRITIASTSIISSSTISQPSIHTGMALKIRKHDNR